MSDDPVIRHLDLIARALESMGYTVEVDYTSALVIVWLDEWPVVIEVRRSGRFKRQGAKRFKRQGAKRFRRQGAKRFKRQGAKRFKRQGAKTAKIYSGSEIPDLTDIQTATWGILEPFYP